jgi:hypothetical protein
MSVSQKSKSIKYLILLASLCLVIIAVIVIWKIRNDINEVYSPSQVNSAVQKVSPQMADLIGRWQRTEGGYVIEIRAVDAGGILDASYYNPKPIHVSHSEAKDSGGLLGIYIELWDENYPGSTYELVYDPARDLLYGTYFTPVAGQSFEVIFSRIE